VTTYIDAFIPIITGKLLFCVVIRMDFIAQFSEYSHVNVQLFIYDIRPRSIVWIVENPNEVI
jgi:hypothetical protein